MDEPPPDVDPVSWYWNQVEIDHENDCFEVMEQTGCSFLDAEGALCIWYDIEGKAKQRENAQEEA